jgi:hypothetical protein
VGDDLAACSRTAPCKTFAGAISKTAAGGEINCLDPGGYGAVNITKSMTIDCGYTHGSILAANFTGVIINGAGINVTLRGLSINGAATTTGIGVRILNAANVNIENVVIENFGGTGANGRGISIETAVAGVRINVINTTIHNTGADAIRSAPTAGSVTLVVSTSDLARGGDAGIRLADLTTATIDRTNVSNYVNSAALVLEQTGAVANVTNSVFANNSFGVFSGLGGSPTTRLYGTTITGSTTSGLQINAGSVFSHGNNAIRGNAGNEVPTAPSLGLQ